MALRPSALRVWLARRPAKYSFGAVGKGIAIPHRGRADAEQRSHVGHEAIGARPIAADRGLGIGPGAVEQGQDAVVEDVEEANQGRIVRVAQAVARVLGQVDGQGTVGAEHAQEVDADAWRPAVLGGVEVGQGGRREGQGGLLPKCGSAHRWGAWLVPSACGRGRRIRWHATGRRSRISQGAFRPRVPARRSGGRRLQVAVPASHQGRSQSPVAGRASLAIARPPCAEWF